MENPIYNCDNDGLGAMLDDLFKKGATEAVVRHPIDGDITITKAQFYKYVAEIDKVRKASPAQRIKIKKRTENVAKQMQIRFRTAMITAEVRTVDITQDGNFGMDIHGKQIDMDGMVFMPTVAYMEGIDFFPNELGCLMDERMKKPPIRIIAQPAVAETPAGEPEAPPMLVRMTDAGESQ